MSGTQVARLKYSPDANGYLTYTYRHWSNGERGTELATRELTLGGDWQVAPALNLFSELSYDHWSGATPSTDDPPFNLFLPDSRLVVFGLNWNVNPKTFVSLSYTDAKSVNANPLLLNSGDAHSTNFNVAILRTITVESRRYFV